jgi:putative spermidine/putrescine transport system permease protein
MAASTSVERVGRAAPGQSRARIGAPALLLFLPALALLVAFFLVPYVNMLVMSFRVPSTSQPYAPGFTLENYVEALTDLYYLRVLWDTAVFGVLTTATCLAISYPVAYHLARSRSRYKGLLYACVLSPLLVGVVIRCYGWIILLANNGLVNDVLKKTGLVETFVPLMYNEFGVAVGLIHVFLPFMILPILGAIQSIDPALEEAAQSLGASRLETMRRVVVPLSLPGIQAGTILVFILTISSYVIPILLGGYKVMLMSTLVVQQLLDAFLWPFGAALALILSVAGALAIYLYLRFTGRLMRGIA